MLAGARRTSMARRAFLISFSFRLAMSPLEKPAGSKMPPTIEDIRCQVKPHMIRPLSCSI
jgi:hypothetical protein